MLRYWIWLSERTGLTKHHRIELLQHFGSVSELYRAEPEDYLDITSLSQAERDILADKSLAGADEIVNQCFELGISVLTWQDAQYPERLRNIYDPPVLLYYRGRLPDFASAPTLALIGSRRASAHGMLTAKRMGYQLGSAGTIIVSGLATGIDAMCMEGALTAGAPVVGMLGCGADVIYPPRNRALYEDTIARGCILTEYPPHTPPIGSHFPVRNRILSGLCDGVVVVEARAHSGALITAGQAVEQGRDVFAVPGSAGNEACAGSNQLLRDGATFAENAVDVLNEYLDRYPALRDCGREPRKLGLSADDVRQIATVVDRKPELKVAAPERSVKKAVDNEGKSNYSELSTIVRTLPPVQSAIMEALKDGPMLVDDLIDCAASGASEVMSALTMLEIRRLVRKVASNRYALAEHIKT